MPGRSALGQDADFIHSTWLHTPGNLTLTGFNPELSNKPFSEKRKEYHHSNIMMTRQVSELETWGEAEIRQRGEAMAEVAAKIWPGPAAPVRGGRIKYPSLRPRDSNCHSGSGQAFATT